MQRLKQKEMEQLRLQHSATELAYKNALKNILTSEQTLSIILSYCQEHLLTRQMENLSEYSPTHISRLVFQEQLSAIEMEFDKLPNKEARIEHFLAIMLKVLKFPFQKCPYYLVGLKDMFYEVVEEGSKVLSYPFLFKYILGQLVTMKEEEQNTSFQVQFAEKKKQDYLLHDNGIKRVYLSKDLKAFISLDDRAYALKIYDIQMKNISKFSPKKEKHNNKFPIIYGFDYSELTMRLGLILSDETITVVHLSNYLTKTPTQFQNFSLNEVVFPTPEKMRLICFIQMMNKWLTVSQEKNSVYLFDMDKVRQQPDKVMCRVKVENQDLLISSVVEVVSLSAICLVAGNTITFWNQSMTEHKYKTLSHCETILVFKYCEEKNQFYLSGKQKSITIFSISRNGHFKIWNFQVNKVIVDFEVFPFFDTIIVADELHDIRLFHEPTKTVYQQQSYSHIVKSKDSTLKTYKISKNEFIVFQTYMLIMQQEKIAIEKDIEYAFLPYTYYNKESLYLSVNNQIISFSLLHGEIRKNYSVESSNLSKHEAFMIGSKTKLFILDAEKNIYEIYSKDDSAEGENRQYRKKIVVDQVVKCHYDQETHILLVVGTNCIQQIRNDSQNNFNSINNLALKDFPNIIYSNYSPKTKLHTFMDAHNRIFQLKLHEKNITEGIKFAFPRDPNDHQDRLIQQLDYNQIYQLYIIMTTKNELYFVQNAQNQAYLNINTFLPYKLKDLKFVGFKYEVVNVGGKMDTYLMTYDDTGFIVEIKLNKHLASAFGETPTLRYDYQMNFKDTQTVINQNIHIQCIDLRQDHEIKGDSKERLFLKAHEKGIVMAMKVKIELLTTLTISLDGYVRLWNQAKVCLFSLKIPSLTKMVWKMKEIEEIKNRKSIDALMQIFKESFCLEKPSPLQLTNRAKKIKSRVEAQKVENTIHLDFQNKDLQDLVLQEEDYSGMKTRVNWKESPLAATQKVYHPWRNKKQFRRIFEKAQSPKKMPLDLLSLRTSLDMTDKRAKPVERKQKLLILPQLAGYEPERNASLMEKNPQVEEEELEKFESCVYVKSERRKKKINEFDEIDKEFKKKDLALTSRKWVPKKKKDKKEKAVEKWESVRAVPDNDPVRAIIHIFQEHNKEVQDTRRGRFIRIPKFVVQ